MGDLQQIEGLADGEVDEFVDGGGEEVESGVGGGDDGAGEGEGAHVFDVDEVEGGLAVADDEGVALFERHGGGAAQEV